MYQGDDKNDNTLTTHGIQSKNIIEENEMVIPETQDNKIMIENAEDLREEIPHNVNNFDTLANNVDSGEAQFLDIFSTAWAQDSHTPNKGGIQPNDHTHLHLPNNGPKRGVDQKEHCEINSSSYGQ